MLKLCVLMGLTMGPTASAQDLLSLTEPTVAEPSAPPEFYGITAGDTLWDISYKFLGNPYYWPRLWSINDYITNPHWIYPGNRIRFTPGTLLEPPRVDLEDGGVPEGYIVASYDYDTAPAECGPDVRFETSKPQADFSSPGFLADKKEVQTLGVVYGAKTGNLWLGELDLVYLELDDIEGVECGDVVQLFRRIKKVKHPETRRKKYGHLFQIVADAVIVHTEGNVATAEIRTSFIEAERGDLVGPVMPVVTRVGVTPPRGDLDGVVVERLNQLAILEADAATVFLDVGRSDGVQVGDTFYTIHRRDEGVDINGWDDKIPQQVVGRVVVVRVEEDHATAVVTDAARRVVAGDRVAMTIE